MFGITKSRLGTVALTLAALAVVYRVTAVRQIILGG